MQPLKLTKKYEHYPGYKDSGVEWLGEIPKGWELASMRRIFTTNKIQVQDNAHKHKILSLTLKGVIPRVLDGSGKNPADYATYQEFKKNDLVFCLFDYDVTPRTIGYVEEDGMLTGAYTRLIPKDGVFSKYYYYYFLSLDFSKELLHLCTGLRNSLSKPLFWSLTHSMPTYAQQREITTHLDEKTALIDQIIEKKKKLIELLREKRTAVINHAVTKGLDPKVEFVESGIDWIGKIPEGWEVGKIKHAVVSINSGIWGEDPLENSDDIQCLRIADFDYDNLTFASVETMRNNPSLKKVKLLRRGDILVEKSGGGEKTPVGRAILFNTDEKMVCANFVDIVRINKWKVLPEFLVLTLSSLYAGRINVKYIKQNTGIQNLDIKEYLGEVFPFPDSATQKQISEQVFEKMRLFEDAVERVEQSIETLKEFKSSLISHVVTGKVKV